MAILEVVKFDGLRNRDWIIYKYPSEKIHCMAQLVVQEGQNAIFVKGGAICDLLMPGTYTLNTDNLPILSGLVNLPFGGRTPFPAEVYFINMTTKLDIFWGTSDPIQLIDPKYFVKLRIRAYGQMGLKLSDCASFFKELIGGMNQAEIVSYEKVKEFYKGLVVLKVKSVIAETILNEKISALEISTKLEDISSRSMEKLEKEFQRYGFRISNFYVQSINFPDEDFEKINQILASKAEFEIMGDSRYSTKRSFDVYEGAATNPGGAAGAMLAGGMGLGAGMHMMEGTSRNSMNQIGGIGKTFCSNCGAENDVGSKFCTSCGAPLQKKVCECGETLKPGAKFCPNCGKKVE